jgi:aspartyl-tRNA(Asn)/glutamyl-tRNA(Gln) amidotransferase subunit A
LPIAICRSMTCDFDFLPAADLVRKIRNAEVSPLAYTEHVLAGIERLDPQIHAFIHWLPEEAMESARLAEDAVKRGRQLGPLHGIPVAIKDNIDVAGSPTTCQSRVLADNSVALRDAEVVARLRAAGAIVIGKLALDEFAIGDQPPDSPWPATRNPWDLERTPGGSSCGAGAAVAAGLVPIAVGTDTGGSIRNPAALCGVVGLKPTYGYLPLGGIFPLAESLDHVGLITRTVADNVLALHALTGEPIQPEAEGISGLRVGVVKHFYIGDFPSTPDVMAALETAIETLRTLGAAVAETKLDSLHLFRDCGWTILKTEAFAVHQRWLQERPEDYGSAARRVLLAGACVDRDSYLEAQRMRVRLRANLAAAMRDVDILVTAVTPAPACQLNDLNAMDKSGNGSMRIPFNVTGNPAIALPIGFTTGGLPLSMQLVGRPMAESTLYRVALAYEAATMWHQRRPELTAS